MVFVQAVSAWFAIKAHPAKSVLSKVWTKFGTSLFIVCLCFLPFSEWRIVNAPINEKVFGIDPDGYRSASLFDAAFAVFCLVLLPYCLKVLKIKDLFSRYLLFWIPGFIIIPILYLYLRPVWPYLTPSVENVIDTRSFIIHFVVAIVVTIYVSQFEMGTIVRASYLYYATAIVLYALLSVAALMAVLFFQTHYPFATPFTISFPFPSQNIAAGFISICALGLLGTATMYGQSWVLCMGVPVLLLAAALTGSRSNMLILLTTVSLFVLIYMLYCKSAPKYAASYSPSYSIILALLLSGVCLIIFYDRQPVQRSLSLLSEVVKTPSIVVVGHPGSPRSELWSAAISGVNAKKESSVAFPAGETFEMSLISISAGCKAVSPSIIGLKTGTKYVVRVESLNNRVALTVFSGQDRMSPMGMVHIQAPLAQMPHLYLFAADTGHDRVNINGWLDNYRIRTRAETDRITFDHDEKLLWYEAWYRGQYGSSKGVMRSNDKKLELSARSAAIHAYVAKARTLPLEPSDYILEYELYLDSLTKIFPPITPVRFYVGFHDTELIAGAPDWETIANGLLVSHSRQPADVHEAKLLKGKWQELRAIEFHSVAHRFQSDAAAVAAMNEEIRCGANHKSRLDGLWRSLTSSEEGLVLRSYNLNGIVPPGTHNPISTEVDEGWSTASYLAERGSTHNVFLDWYYYVGAILCALFVLFVLTLDAVLVQFVVYHRGSSYFPFYLATLLQVLVIVANFYAHPNLWVKYIWFLFGVAGAVMVRGSEEQD